MASVESFNPQKNEVKTSSPWGKVNTPAQVLSFSDVMSEEYAKQLNAAESSPIKVEIDEKLENPSSNVETNSGLVTTDSEDYIVDGTENDELLAQLLQLEFNKESDGYIHSMQKQVNGPSKVTMSYEKFCTVHPYDKQDNRESNNERNNYYDEDWDDSEDDDDYIDEERSVTVGKPKKGGEIITKHDAINSERKNAKSVETFPLSFNSGDISKKDIRLPNHVYNKLKVHSMKEERNEYRLHEKQEHSTHEGAIDENTRLLIYKMVNNGTLDTLGGIISTGKEAVVVYAKGGSNDDGPLPSECALKIYKTTLNEFKTREKYITDDHRFRDRFSKQNPRKIIRLWAEKEFRNLKRMEDAQLNCPHAVLLRKHILVMKFIGTDGNAAMKLKEANLSPKQYQQAYSECIHFLKTMYKECNLIHADFSEYNILWHNKKCYFIDVSQSIEPTNSHAYHFLYRDCCNVTNFFSKAGVSGVMKENELFKYVCGKELEYTSLDEIENEVQTQFERDQELLTFGLDESTFSFDYHFAASLKGNENNTNGNNTTKDDTTGDSNTATEED